VPEPTHKPPVRESLRELVLALPPGGRLPPERALAERWGVARMTVRQAIAALAREGLVRTVHGSGSIRVPAPMALRVRLGSFAEAVDAQGMHPSTRLLGLDVDDDPPREALEHLGAGAGELVRLRRLRLGDDIPLALEETWLPHHLLPTLTESTAAESLYAQLAAHDLLPDAGEETVRADLPDEDEVKLLGISASRPVLRLTRRATSRGVPIEYARAVLPSDRHELSFALDRDRFRIGGAS
jgi:GntR family transcriptional regulator